MSIHTTPHPLAGRTVTIRDGVADPRGMVVAGAQARVEDWWDRLFGTSWGSAHGNPAALQYAMRAGFSEALGGHPIPIDDEVLYVKIGPYGHLVHVCEIELAERAA